MSLNKKKLLKEYSWVQKEWEFEQNQHLNIQTISVISSKIAWWVCQLNSKHKWEASICNRTKGTGCPYCAGKKVLPEESFGNIRSELLMDWNYDRNEVSPYKVTVSSNKTVWWKCKKGHEWEASPNNRGRGSGCPYCSRIKVTKESSLASTHPELSMEWHTSKNNMIIPEHVFYGSNKKVWWICKKGHEWETSPNSRSRGTGCPYCSNKKASSENNLEVKRPELLREWNFDKNLGISPKKLTIGSDVKIWWKCSMCGYEWKSRVNKRAKGQGCPDCSKQHGTSFTEQALFFYLSKFYKDINSRLIFQYEKKNFEIDIFIPEINLAIEYDGEYHSSPAQIKRDEEKNRVMKNLKINLIRIREETLPIIEWQDCHIIRKNNSDSLNTMIISVITHIFSNYKSKCVLNKESEQLKQICIERDSIKIMEQYIKKRQLNNFTVSHPNLSKEWNFDKNRQLKPEYFTVGSNKKVWWICKEGHEWETSIAHRCNGTNCPYCSGKKVIPETSLAYRNPSLAKDWHWEKNKDMSPLKIAVSSNKKVWWKCKEGHEWEAKVNNRSILMRNCPYCYGRIATKDNCLQKVNPDLAKQWHPSKNRNLTPWDVKPNSGLRAWWKCERNHEWEAIIQSRNKGRNCPHCREFRSRVK